MTAVITWRDYAPGVTTADSYASIARRGRGSLDDLRGMLGKLHGSELSTAPQPTLAELSALVPGRSATSSAPGLCWSISSSGVVILAGGIGLNALWRAAAPSCTL